MMMTTLNMLDNDEEDDKKDDNDQWKTELNIPSPARMVLANLMHTMLGGSRLCGIIIIIIIVIIIITYITLGGSTLCRIVIIIITCNYHQEVLVRF